MTSEFPFSSKKMFRPSDYCHCSWLRKSSENWKHHKGERQNELREGSARATCPVYSHFRDARDDRCLWPRQRVPTRNENCLHHTGNGPVSYTHLTLPTS